MPCCSICKQGGHNKRTCPLQNLVTAAIAVATHVGVAQPNQVPQMNLNLAQLTNEELEAKKSYFQLIRKEQWEIADNCVHDLMNGKNISIKAEEKSGKRGIMECIHVILMLSYLEDSPFFSNDEPKSIYVTALNRKDTKVQHDEQEKFGITSCILRNATKSNELLVKIVEIMTDESNNSMVYIHLDECDYGTGDTQSLSKLYNHPSISLWKHRIKFITYSATPEELEKSDKVEVPDWAFHTFVPADTYFGARKYLDNDLIYTPEEFFDGARITAHGKGIIGEVKGNCLNESNPEKIKSRNIIVVRTAPGQLNVINNLKVQLEEDNGCEIQIYDQKNGFEWGGLNSWAKLGKEEYINPDNGIISFEHTGKPVVIFICQTCTRSTEIHKLGHKRIYAWHDNRSLSDNKCYNTLSQAIGRVKHYTDGVENTIKLYCDINVIKTTLGMPTPGLDEKDKKFGQRITNVKISNSHEWLDDYGDVDSVPEHIWKEDVPTNDGHEKRIGGIAERTTLIGKNGKWHHKNNLVPRIFVFDSTNTGILGHGHRYVCVYKSTDSTEYIVREYDKVANEEKKFEQQTTNKSMWSQPH
jgi:hypothetical protein